MVHIRECLVFANHAPDKSVASGSDAGMDRPAGHYKRLLVFNDNVPGFGGFPDKMEYPRVLLHTEVEIHLHSTIMGMGGHGVPDGALFKQGHPHYQLTALHHIGMHKLVNGPLIRFFPGPEIDLFGILQGDYPGRT